MSPTESLGSCYGLFRESLRARLVCRGPIPSLNPHWLSSPVFLVYRKSSICSAASSGGAVSSPKTELPPWIFHGLYSVSIPTDPHAQNKSTSEIKYAISLSGRRVWHRPGTVAFARRPPFVELSDNGLPVFICWVSDWSVYLSNGAAVIVSLPVLDW